MQIQVAVSDLSYKWAGCKRCFWAKYREGWREPKGIFPGVFHTLDKIQREYWQGKLAAEVCPTLPRIVLQAQKQKIKSQPIQFGPVAIVLSGEMDVYGTDGRQTVILDNKVTGKLDQEKVDIYSQTLRAYAYCKAYPEEGDPWPPARHLGLVGLIPRKLNARGILEVEQIFLPIHPDGFLPFMAEVARLLAGPKPPAKEKCGWCSLRER